MNRRAFTVSSHVRMGTISTACDFGSIDISQTDQAIVLEGEFSEVRLADWDTDGVNAEFPEQLRVITIIRATSIDWVRIIRASTLTFRLTKTPIRKFHARKICFAVEK
jgi:hypothetical protein